MRIYSVWNGNNYDIYKSDLLPTPSLKAFSRNLSGCNLGADPGTLIGTLPVDAEYSGRSDSAVGTIVNGTMSMGSIVKYVAIAAILYYFFK